MAKASAGLLLHVFKYMMSLATLFATVFIAVVVAANSDMASVIGLLFPRPFVNHSFSLSSDLKSEVDRVEDQAEAAVAKRAVELCKN